ncbi:MAG: acyltransferase family protein [Capsulimonadaceae bacterium]
MSLSKNEVSTLKPALRGKEGPNSARTSMRESDTPSLQHQLWGSSRLNNFDFLRLFFATMVIFAHSYILSTGTNLVEPFFRLTHHQEEGGGIAVDCFFMISGFLVSQSWMRSDMLAYFKKRALRIFPGFVVALLVCVFVVGPLGGANWSTYFRNPHTYDMLQIAPAQFADSLPNVFAHNPYPNAVNISLWTIPFELQCYLMVAVFGMLRAYRNRIRVLAIFVAIYGLYNVEPFLPLIHVQPPIERDHFLRLVTYFMSGMVAFHYRDKVPHSGALFGLSILALILSLRVGFSWINPIFGAYALFFVAFERSLPLLNAARYGDFSYGTYLYAFPIQQLLLYHCPGFFRPLTLFFTATMVTYCVAIVSWRLVEQPCLNLKPRIHPPAPAINPPTVSVPNAPADDKPGKGI